MSKADWTAVLAEVLAQARAAAEQAVAKDGLPRIAGYGEVVIPGTYRSLVAELMTQRYGSCFEPDGTSRGYEWSPAVGIATQSYVPFHAAARAVVAALQKHGINASARCRFD